MVVPAGYDELVLPDKSIEVVEKSQSPTLSVPGIHALRSTTDASLEELEFAVNLDPTESRTDVMSVDQLSALGVNTGMQLASAEEFEQRRKLLDIELENRQKIWKWLVLGAIALIIGETWLAGKTDRRSRVLQVASQGETNE